MMPPDPALGDLATRDAGGRAMSVLADASRG